MTDLSIAVGTTGCGAVMTIGGDLDFHSAPRVRDALAVLHLEPGQLLVLDLTGLTFCDSSGISILVSARNHTHGLRADTVLAAVPAHVSRILQTVGLDRILSQYPDVPAATASWTAPGT
ncbi:anti-sigma factor antagonist [Kitasatospora sp. NE20-6]|uniref:STAS domain-containing protein n=1 Tax=Kitasatospora sp. NE20-6 TaxID=2859066 RepID=UPI0034DC14E4